MTITITKNSERPRRQVNISEWNPSVKAYLKPLTALERLAYNDLVQTYFNTNKRDVERAEAVLQAVILCLVDEDGKQLFSLDQLEDLKAAAFDPVNRVIMLNYDSNTQDESLAKNS